MVVIAMVIVMFFVIDILNHLIFEKRNYIVRNNGSLTKEQDNSLCSFKNQRLISKENGNRQGRGVIFFKVLYIIVSYFYLMFFITFTLKPYLLTIEKGELAAVQWMVLPVILITISIIFNRRNWNKTLFDWISIKMEKISITMSRLMGISVSILFNIFIFCLALLASLISSFGIIYSSHLCLCGLWYNILFLIISIIASFGLMVYFRFAASYNLLCQYIEIEEEPLHIDEDEGVNKEKEPFQEGIYISQLNECSNVVKRKFNLFFANKHYFPFNKGIQRLLFVLWFAISAYIEISHWILRGKGIENYGWGFVSLAVLPCLYVIVVWIYNGFKEK